MRLDQYSTQATSVTSGNLLFLGQLINGNWVYYPVTVNLLAAYCNSGNSGSSFSPTCRLITNSTNVTVQASDNGGTIVIRQATPAATSVTFPSGLSAGFYVTIKDGAGNAASDLITVHPMASTTIDGQTTDIISINYGAKTYIYDGTQLNII